MSGGRPHQPTDKARLKVTALAACGTRYEVIAKYLHIERTTLRKHYKKELTEARTDANAMVAKSLFAAALAGDTASKIFWLKTRAGWRETSTHELTGANGKPLFPHQLPLGITFDDVSFEDGAPGLPIPAHAPITFDEDGVPDADPGAISHE